MRRHFKLVKKGRDWTVVGVEPSAAGASPSTPMIPPQVLAEERRQQLLAFLRTGMASAVARLVLEEGGEGEHEPA